MSIHDQTNKAQGANKPAGQQQQQRTLNMGGQGQGQTSGNPLEFMDLLGTGSALLPPRSSSEVLNKVSTAIADTIKVRYNGTMPKDWHLISIDHNTISAPASVVAVVAVKRTPSGANAFVTNLALEAARVQLAPTTAQLQQRQLQITTTLGQVFGDDVWANIQRRIGENLDLPAGNVHEVSTIVMPKDYDLETPDSVMRLAYLSTVASAIAVAGGVGNKLRLAEIVRDPKGQSQFVTRVDFTGQQSADLLGRPVRSDLVVNTLLSQQADANASYRNEKQLVSLSAFVEVNYVGPQPQAAPYPGAAPVYGTQRYAPELVITNCASDFHDFDMSRALFCLASAGALDKGGVWARAFLPRPTGKKSLNLRDIGAIGYELDETEGKAISTARDQFTTDDLGVLLNKFFYQSPLISMDIDPNGPYNWVFNEFISAGSGDPQAVERIIRAANDLTGNRFSQHFQGGQICQLRHYIADGTYVNEDGEVRSLADIDYIAALNLFASIDKGAFKTWSNSFEDPNMSDIERLAEREALMRGRLSSVDVVTYKRRITFDKKFLEALEKSMLDCGYRPIPDSIQTMFGTQAVRGNAALLALASGNFGNQMFATAQPQVRGGAMTLNGRITTFGE